MSYNPSHSGRTQIEDNSARTFLLGHSNHRFYQHGGNIAPAKLIGRICECDDIASFTLKSDWKMNNLEF